MKHILIIGLLTSARILAHAQELEIQGKIVGHENKALKQAHVYLNKDMSTILNSSEFLTPTDSLGNFIIKFYDLKPKLIILTGENHESLPVLVKPKKSGSYSLSVQLTPIRKVKNKPQILSSHNDYYPIEMEEINSGVYEVIIETTKDEIVYGILGVGKKVISGQYGSTVPALNGLKINSEGYFSMVKVKDGKITIRYDINAIPSELFEPRIQSNDYNIESFAQLYQNVGSLEMKYFTEMRDTTNSSNLDNNIWSPDFKKLENQIGKEVDPDKRDFMVFTLAYLAYRFNHKFDSVLAVQGINQIPSDSYLWELNSFAIIGLLNSAGGMKGNLKTVMGYLENIAYHHPSAQVRAFALEKLVAFTFKNSHPNYEKYYNKLINEYGDTFSADKAIKLYSKTLNISIGNQVPRFSLTLLDNHNSIISDEILKGKVYLIDFWATWCGPCIADLPELHEAYKLYNKKGFEILSISFDDKLDHVKIFREKKWMMPWLHSYIQNGFESKIAKTFEVFGLPKPILIDQSGKIIEVRPDKLRGTSLLETLENVFNNK